MIPTFSGEWNYNDPLKVLSTFSGEIIQLAGSGLESCHIQCVWNVMSCPCNTKFVVYSHVVDVNHCISISNFNRYRICCPLCCFLDSHFVVSVTPFAVSVAHFVEMYSHFVDSVTHFVVSDQQNGNVFFQNVMCRPECWFSVWVESTILVLEKPRINNSCLTRQNQQIVSLSVLHEKYHLRHDHHHLHHNKQWNSVWVKSTILVLEKPRINQFVFVFVAWKISSLS